MSITVGDIFTRFPNFAPENMRILVGSSDYDGSTQIKLSNIAGYTGPGAQDLSIFTAEREGRNFTNMLSKGQRTEVNAQVGIKDDSKDFAQNNSNAVSSVIPMDKSIWDIERAKMA